MKAFKFIGFIALTAVIVLGMAVCQMPTGADTGNTPGPGNGGGPGQVLPSFTGDDFNFEELLKNFDPSGELNLSELTITGHFPDGSTHDYTLDELVILGILQLSDVQCVYNEESGEYVISVVLDGDTYTFITDVDEDGNILEIIETDLGRILKRIEIAVGPDTTEYGYGEDLVLDGLVVYAVYEDDSSSEIEITIDNISGYDKLWPGLQTITVAYKGQKTTFDVYVADPLLTDVVFDFSGVKKGYGYETELDLSGLVLTEIWQDETLNRELVYGTDFGDVDLEISGYDSTNYEDQPQTVTIFHKDYDGYPGNPGSFEVYVAEPGLKDVVFDFSEVKTEYDYNTHLNLSGLKITEKYQDGREVELVVGVGTLPGSLDKQGYDRTNSGTQTVYVSYKGFSGSFVVTVGDPRLTGIEFNFTNVQTKYGYNQDLNFDHLVITENWQDGDVELVYGIHVFSKDLDVQGYDRSDKSEQPQTVSVVYNGYSDYPGQFTVTVDKPGLKGVEFDFSKVQKNYGYGEVIDFSGLVITEIWEDGNKDLEYGKEFNLFALSHNYEATECGDQTVDVSYKGYTDSFEVNVAEPKLTEILFDFSLVKKNPEYNTALDFTGLKITEQWEDNRDGLKVYGENLAIGDLDVSGYSAVLLGAPQTVNVVYKGYSGQFTATVVPGVLDSITISPDVKGIEVLYGTTGAALKAMLDGKVTANYLSGAAVTLALGDFDISDNYDPVADAPQTITVTYDGKSDTFTVTIVPGELESLEIVQNKTSYYVGDSIGADDIEVTAVYNSGKRVEVSDYMIDVAVFLTAGDAIPVTVSYNDGATEVNKTIYVKVVTLKVTSIEIVTEPSKTTYYEGDALITDGLTVKAVYENASEKLISDYEIDADVLTVVGEAVPVTVSYQAESETFTAWFTVKVIALAVTDLELISAPAKLDYIHGEVLNTAGLAVKATYNSGKVENPVDIAALDISQSTLSATGIVPVTVPVTVGYKGKEVSFNVTVKAVVDSINISVSSFDLDLGTSEAELRSKLAGKVTAHYNNGAAETISNAGTLELSGYNPNVPGVQNVTVGYQGVSGQITVTVTIPVEWVLDHIEVVTPPTFTYAHGQAYGQYLNLADLVVQAVYDNGKSGIISSLVEISPYSTTTLGTVTIIVSYEGNTDTFNVDFVPIGWTLTNVTGSGGGTGTRTFTITFDGLTALLDLKAADIKATGQANNGSAVNGTNISLTPTGNNAYGVSVDFGSNVRNETVTAVITKYGIEGTPHN